MNSLLALETTSEICSVALGHGRNILAESVVAPRRHNELILTMIDRLLSSSSLLTRGGLELVAFSCGPGSFTGVRLGAAVAQGIAQGLGINVVPVPTSDAMAHRALRLNPSLSKFAIQRKSHKGKAYISSYSVIDGTLKCVAPDQLEDVQEIKRREHIVSDLDLRVSAEDILALAQERIDSQVAPHLALPNLIDGDTPYVASESRRNGDGSKDEIRKRPF